MSTKDKIIKALLESKDFISGEELSESIGVSRTYVWKVINALRDEGYEIDSATNKGYKLKAKPGGLVESRLKHELAEFAIEKVSYFETIDSTNLEAKRMAGSNLKNSCFIADEQTLGRGRRGRTWESPKGSGCYFSLLVRPDIRPTDASMFTLLAGLAVKETLNEDFGMDVKIKWPNDIVVGGKKLCGILTEMSAEIDAVNYLVVGIGLNVSQETFPKEIENIATSVAQVIPKKSTFDKHDYIVGVIRRLMSYIDEFNEFGNISYIKETYEKACVNVNTKVSVVGSREEFIGVGEGITDTGELKVRKENGELLVVNSGEVSVRGVYGYI